MAGDSSTKAMGSLYDLLLDYVDTAWTHDSTYEISSKLLEHYDELPKLSLREMSELCFVSQASFSRFCRHLGFEDFADFKRALDSANYRLVDDYTRGFVQRLAADDGEALGAYRASLAEVMDSALTPENVAAAEALLDALEQADRVVLLSHHFPWHICRYLQGKLLQLGWYVQAPQSFQHQLEAAEALGPRDLAIVCSVNGTYSSHYQPIMRALFESGARLAAITQNRHALFLNRVDVVLGCGNSNDNDVGKYALLMTIDYLVMSAIRRRQLGDGTR